MTTTTATTSVKAWTFTTTSYPSTLQLTDTNVPSTPPTPTSIIIKPHAVSLNPVDIQLMNLPLNNLPSFIPMLGSFAGPKIAGRDFSGVVLAAGSSSSFHPGDEIMGINMGMPGTGFLSRAVCLDTSPNSGATLIKKPTHLTHVQAASLPCVYLTARTSIEKCTPYLTNPNPSTNKIAILGGSSSTGIYTIKLAKQRHWTVLTTCSSRNTNFVKSLGADHVTDYTTSPTAVVDALLKFQPDAIIDCVGGTETINLARKKYVTIVGDKTGRSSMGGSALYLTHPRMVLRWFWGWMGWSRTSYDCIVLESNPEYLAEVEMLNNKDTTDGGDIVIDSVFSFDRVKEAFERLDTGRCRGKVVVNLEE